MALVRYSQASRPTLVVGVAGSVRTNRDYRRRVGLRGGNRGKGIQFRPTTKVFVKPHSVRSKGPAEFVSGQTEKTSAVSGTPVSRVNRRGGKEPAPVDGRTVSLNGRGNWARGVRII